MHPLIVEPCPYNIRPVLQKFVDPIESCDIHESNYEQLGFEITIPLSGYTSGKGMPGILFYIEKFPAITVQ